MIGKILQKGQIVVYESTVDPGSTEEVCIPILVQESWLEYIKDFKVWYFLKLIQVNETVDKIAKVVAACDEESLNSCWHV